MLYLIYMMSKLLANMDSLLSRSHSRINYGFHLSNHESTNYVM